MTSNCWQLIQRAKLTCHTVEINLAGARASRCNDKAYASFEFLHSTGSIRMDELLREHLHLFDHFGNRVVLESRTEMGDSRLTIGL